VNFTKGTNWPCHIALAITKDTRIFLIYIFFSYTRKWTNPNLLLIVYVQHKLHKQVKNQAQQQQEGKPLFGHKLFLVVHGGGEVVVLIHKKICKSMSVFF